jgi:hypothetical protein
MGGMILNTPKMQWSLAAIFGVILVAAVLIKLIFLSPP